MTHLIRLVPGETWTARCERALTRAHEIAEHYLGRAGARFATISGPTPCGGGNWRVRVTVPDWDVPDDVMFDDTLLADEGADDPIDYEALEALFEDERELRDDMARDERDYR